MKLMNFPIQDVTRYCALAYSANGSLSAEHVFTIVAELRSGICKLLVRPGWTAMIAADDHSYVHEMLSDMRSRLSDDRSSLFQQLSSLSVGPLITYSAGGGVQHDPQIAMMLLEFVEA